jgi:GNAT superfamily N-acetyltransferase
VTAPAGQDPPASPDPAARRDRLASDDPFASPPNPPISQDSIIIREAQASDVQALLEMFAELAEFEELTHELRATEKQLSEALFGPHPAAEALIADRSRASVSPIGPRFDQRASHQAIGYALYFPTFSSFLATTGIWLEDLFVRPAHRRAGVGRALLAAVAARLRERGGARLEWAALDWNEPALSFYSVLGARTMPEWITHRLIGEDLDRLANEHPRR